MFENLTQMTFNLPSIPWRILKSSKWLKLISCNCLWEYLYQVLLSLIALMRNKPFSSTEVSFSIWKWCNLSTGINSDALWLPEHICTASLKLAIFGIDLKDISIWLNVLPMMVLFENLLVANIFQRLEIIRTHISSAKSMWHQRHQKKRCKFPIHLKGIQDHKWPSKKMLIQF